MEIKIPENLFLKGGAPCSINEMTAEQEAEAARAIVKRTRDIAFATNTPVIYSIKETLYAEYQDGRIYKLTMNPDYSFERELVL